MLAAVWLVSLLCADRSLSRTNRSSWLWTWPPSFSALGLMVVLIKGFFSENLRQGSGCSLFRHLFKCQMWQLSWYLLFDVCVCLFWCLCMFCLLFVYVCLMFVYVLFDVCVCTFYLMFVYACFVWCLRMYVLFDVCVCMFCLMLVYACFVWCLYRTGFEDWLDEWFIYERSFEMWICLWQNVLRWPCVADRTLKSKY